MQAESHREALSPSSSGFIQCPDMMARSNTSPCAVGHHGHEFPTQSQPFPPSRPAQRKAKSGLTKGYGEEKIPGEEKEWAAKSLSFAPSSTRAFQGDLTRWQLEWRPQPAPCVRPGQEPTAWGWLWLAFVPLALLSLSQRQLFPPRRRVPRGQ